MRRISQGLGAPEASHCCAQAPLNPRTLFSLLIGVLGSTLYAMGDANSEPWSVQVWWMAWCFHFFWFSLPIFSTIIQNQNPHDQERPKLRNRTSFSYVCILFRHPSDLLKASNRRQCCSLPRAPKNARRSGNASLLLPLNLGLRRQLGRQWEWWGRVKLGSRSDTSHWDLKAPGLFWVGSNALLVAFTSVSEKYVVRNVDQAARQRKCVKASRPVQS